MKTRAKSIVRDKCMIDARHVVRDRALASEGANYATFIN
jgi:hypothetical protein